VCSSPPGRQWHKKLAARCGGSAAHTASLQIFKKYIWKKTQTLSKRQSSPNPEKYLRVAGKTSSSVSNNLETLGRGEEIPEKLIFWLLLLKRLLSIACFAMGGEAAG